ncbi:hypothetical protein K438DRAFT_382148 [Mycena galopus ATCC 62051]|nr:hypothetical protein K438DRAFT_382148 [Mycena galopus ATCC 62051]
MRRYGNRLQFFSYFCSLFSRFQPRQETLSRSQSSQYKFHYHQILSMPQPHTLESAARSSRTIRSLRVTPRPLIRRTTRYQRLINRKAAHETSHSKPAIHALRKRLLRRDVESGRLLRSASTQEASCARDTEQPGSPAALPIVLPQLPILSLPRLYPETDSGYCSDASRSPSCSPTTNGPERFTRRYIRPDLLAASPSDCGSLSDFRVRLSARPVLSILPPSASRRSSPQDRYRQ